MFGDLLPEKFAAARKKETERGTYSVKPGSVLFDRQLWSTNAAGEPYNAFQDAGSCDLMFIMGTSLSGLTIDNLAHHFAKPRVILDMTDVPVKNCSGWRKGKDSFMQRPIDETILDILLRMGWLQQLLAFLPHLCLGSLRNMARFFSANEGKPEDLEKIEQAIQDEIQREKQFYGDEASPM